MEVGDLTSEVEDLKAHVGISNLRWGAEVSWDPPNLTPVCTNYPLIENSLWHLE